MPLFPLIMIALGVAAIVFGDGANVDIAGGFLIGAGVARLARD